MLFRALPAAALALAAVPALAGGFAPTAATPAPAAPSALPSADWSGFYIGGQVGRADLSLRQADGDSSPEAANGEGSLMGLHAGYMRDLGRVVLGAELDWDRTDLDLVGTGTVFHDTDDVGTLDSIGRAKLRLGFDAGRVLPYVTAGVARAGITFSDPLDGDTETTASGRFVGLGALFAVNDRLTVGVEALRHDFGGPTFEDRDFDTTIDTVSIRASWRF